VNKGADDLIVSENDTATYFNPTTEQITAPHLNKTHTRFFYKLYI